MNKTERMKELIALLTEAGKAYYQEDREISKYDILSYFINFAELT